MTLFCITYLECLLFISRVAHSHVYRDAKIQTLIQFSKFYPTPPTFYSNKFHIHPIEPASANCPTCLRKLSSLPPHLVEPASQTRVACLKSVGTNRRVRPSPDSVSSLSWADTGLPLRKTGHPQGDAPTSVTLPSKSATRGDVKLSVKSFPELCGLRVCTIYRGLFKY